MQMRRLNEATIGILALGKAAELGRQLVVATDEKFANKMAAQTGADAKTLQEWASGYIAFDAVITLTGVLGMVQGMRKNRKGAGQAAQVQSITLLIYSVYYLFYSLTAVKKTNAKLLNVVLSFAHGAAGVVIYRFAQRALK